MPPKITSPQKIEYRPPLEAFPYDTAVRITPSNAIAHPPAMAPPRPPEDDASLLCPAESSPWVHLFSLVKSTTDASLSSFTLPSPYND